VLESARLFLQGLSGADYDPKAWPPVDLVIPEGDDVNNTLCVHNCAAQRTGSAGEAERAAVLRLLEPAARRLSALLSIDLGPEDVPNIAGMCGFDTARTGGWSAWCHLLHPEEWEAVGYVAEVERWYAFGGGSVSYAQCVQLTAAVLADHGGELRSLHELTPGGLGERARRAAHRLPRHR
jgi:hypothetical protein